MDVDIRTEVTLAKVCLHLITRLRASESEHEPEAAAEAAVLCDDFDAMVEHARQSALEMLREDGAIQSQVNMIHRSGVRCRFILPEGLPRLSAITARIASGLGSVISLGRVSAYFYADEIWLADPVDGVEPEEWPCRTAILLRVSHPERTSLLFYEVVQNAQGEVADLQPVTECPEPDGAQDPLAADLYEFARLCDERLRATVEASLEEEQRRRLDDMPSRMVH